jgi:hypothetical protein
MTPLTSRKKKHVLVDLRQGLRPQRLVAESMRESPCEIHVFSAYIDIYNVDSMNHHYHIIIIIIIVHNDERL